MALRWLPISLLLLTGCQRAEVRACQDFIKDGLKSPSSYKLVSSDVRDEKLTESNFLAETGQKPSDIDRRSLRYGDSELRLISISYDAQNSYGTALRSTEICAFRFHGDQQPSTEVLKSRLLFAESTRSFRQLARSGAISSVPAATVPSEPLYPCCM